METQEAIIEPRHRPLHKIVIEVEPWFPEGGGVNVSIRISSGHKEVIFNNKIPEQGTYRLEKLPLNQFLSEFSRMMCIAEKATVEAMREDE